jgi:hypothetical protein
MAQAHTGGERWAQNGHAPESQTASPEQLLALQLAARGYTPEQIGPLVDQTPNGARVLLDEARRRLGAADLAGAVREATRQRLIV